MEKGQNEINVRAEARNRKGWREGTRRRKIGEMEGRQAKFAQRSYKRRAVGTREERGDVSGQNGKCNLKEARI